MKNKRIKGFTIRDISLMALLTIILFIQEEALSILPNAQLTVFFIVLYSKKLGFSRTSIIVCLHVILDNLIMGSFNFLYTPFMLVGWMVIPVTMCTIFKRIESNIALAFIGCGYAIIYSWIFVVPSCVAFQVAFTTYLVADIFFEIMLASSSFLSILLFYKPVAKIMDQCLKWQNNQ